ncbi:uncharacterized protein ATNIH1004_007555 [Aspergillus tanneri]|uniref:Azaphilone pigments biosynthesis cluster protein L N-terminal domain-containing protein n=1 Tax=Aspergillus tanneri TaxID=1220188 RepID=A0A5M9MNT7_9EURO|nr:uncharacterized protein ATNIH1004_007555 [Aspergillus tanneri]KAA8646129.1 hypothetical protein ATNIH1004_007555 [Aspergillus tanneri]
MRHTSKVSHQVIQEYNEMIQDTAYNLEVHLQQIDEKMTTDLEDEREVTKQCLRVCEDAKSYIESLTNRETHLLQGEGSPQTTAEYDMRQFFEAQLLTRQALYENRDSFAQIISRLGKRLESLEDTNTPKQCLEVCKVASEVSRQKIYRIGEVTADGDSDQVVVTTLADLFDIKKALSKGNSAQLVGSMTDESLRHLAEKRYTSRFGALASDLDSIEAGTTNSSSIFETPKNKHAFSSQTPGPETRCKRPSSNEMRKRATGGATG